jgi:heme-degrading monooxygenase HmoA
MEDNFIWMTTRRIKPGMLADFTRTWRPERHPDGMLHAYAYWTDDEQEIIAVSSWDSRESCETWRASWEETRRRAAMAPYVVSEQDGFYRGRELIVPPPPFDGPGEHHHHR